MTWSPEQLDAVLRKGHVRINSVANARMARPGNSAKQPTKVPVPKLNTEDMLAQQLHDAGIVLERQYRWHPTRKFRADFADPARKLLVELDGAVHRLKKMLRHDIEKSQQALFEGWCLLRISPNQVRQGLAVEIVRRGLACP